MKLHALVCLLLLLSAAPAWGQYDQQPLHMQYVTQDGKPTSDLLADRRRLVYPKWQDRLPFVDVMLESDTILARGFVIDTLWFVPDGPMNEFYSDGTLRQMRHYTVGQKSGRWVDFYPSGDTSRIYSFSNDTVVSSVCFNLDYTVIHTGQDCGEKEANPFNLIEVKKMVGYPPVAFEAGLQGNVTLRFFVNSKGVVEKHRVMQQAHPLFTKAILKHAYKLRFEPAQLHGKSIPAWVTVPFDFKIVKGR